MAGRAPVTKADVMKGVRTMIVALAARAQGLLDRLVVLDFIPSLLLRVYLAPIFWMAGSQKAAHFADTVE